MPRGVEATPIARLLGRHCAGAAHRPAPETMLEYLRRRPLRSHRGLELAARSMLNGCSVPDLLELVVDCGIPADRLAAHAKALHVTRKPVLACLGQLTEDGPLRPEESPAPEPG